jgi:hypothetical protein
LPEGHRVLNSVDARGSCFIFAALLIPMLPE